ncbi:hypothetical protein E8E13_010305 [Curvularia kusanoi]|uniref:V-type c subunit family protein n=1 Tax=Curvularia kusanoi TaxID=90978 RepID=A0A9P4TNU2_CURKU|nr:hypothetical protein E8E13_010305 [Curvularia kusanoi]
MALLLAQQCRLLRAPRGAAGALQRMARPVHAMPARSYSSQNGTAAQDEQTPRAVPIRKIVSDQPAIRRISYLPKKPKTHSKEHEARNKKLQARNKELSHFVTPSVAESTPTPVESAILIPASITAAKPEHFIDKITPLQSSNSITSQNHVIFLLTPSFAHWLLDDQNFLKEALDKLYYNCARESPPHANTATPPKIHATCAVVDRLPQAQPLDNSSLQQHVEGRASQPPVTETGHEGIAYVVLPTKAETNLNLQEKPVASCIDFLTHTKTDAQGRQYDRIRVPLANTVFQTGEPYTMIQSKWEYDASHKLSMVKRDSRKRATFNLSTLPVSSKNAPLSYVARELSIPLIPLTVPRQVDSHMGNIIRSIVGPDGGATITAATELEQVVPQYFKSRNEPAQATSAWALVIPKSLAQQCTSTTLEWLGRSSVQQTDAETSPGSSLPKDFERLWQSPQPIWSNGIQDALNKGARLHKVLSGGGGWGKKAGLLSLDPMPIGPPRDKGTPQAAVEDDYHSVDDFSVALKPVIQDGDYIQFFTSPAPAQESDETANFARLRQLEEAAGKGVWTYEFGVIPSTVDAMPGGSWQHKGEASIEIAVFKGSFGALVEGGLTLMTALNVDHKSGYAEANRNTTTIDVPFSRWSAVQLRPTMNPSLTVGEARNLSKAQSTVSGDDPS